MENFSLPLKAFAMDTETQLSTIPATPDDSAVGYILEVDLKYADSLYKLHKHFPLAPTREKVETDCLSDYQLSLL